MTRPAPPRPPVLPWIAAGAVVAAFGVWLTQGAVGLSTVAWMNIYRAEDFRGLDAVLGFFRDLRIAIPPWLAAIEFLNVAVTGTVDWVTVHLYRACLVGGYVLAVAFTYPSRRRLVAAVALSVVFLWSARLIHPAGPNVYDVVYPVLLLGYFLCLRAAPRSGAMALLAGILLALAELTRPFVLLLLPLLLLGAVLALRPGPRARSLLVLLPVLLLSGGWHAWQLGAHGQVFWSNHGGFNLHRAWPMVAMPALVPETVPAKIAPDRLPNFNTPEHAENSRRLQQAVLRHVAANPGASAMHVLERLAAVVSGETVLHGEPAQGAVIEAYKVIVKFPALWVLLGAVAIGISLVARPSGAGRVLADDGNMLILVTAATLVVVALTEAGEEARFMIAILPALAAVPAPRLDFRGRSAAQPRRLAWAAAILAVLAVELFAQGAVRRSTGTAEGTRIDAAPRPHADGTLKLGVLHIRGGRWTDRERDAEKIARCLQGLDAAGLNGVGGERPFSQQLNQAATLAGKAGMASVFAPTERRWWSDWYGNALLAAVPVEGWRREPLPAPRTPPRRNMLVAAIDAPGLPQGRPVRLLVTQVDFGYDHALQLDLVLRRFRELPVPAVLMGELNTTREAEGMRELLAMPDVRAFTEMQPSPVGPRPIDWIVTRGFDLVSGAACATGVADRPLLSVVLRPLALPGP